MSTYNEVEQIAYHAEMRAKAWVHPRKFYVNETTDGVDTEEVVAELAVLYKKLAESNKLLREARDFVAEDVNCGPCGLGLICMIDDFTNK